MSKKFLAALLAILMVISMIPMTAMAAGEPATPTIGAAPLGNAHGIGETDGLATTYSAKEAGGTITVTATGLRYHKTTSDPARTGFFVGVAIPTADAGATYATGWGAVPETISADAYTADNRDNTIADAEGNVTHDTFYFDIANAYKPAQGQDTGKQGIVGEGADAKVQGYVSVKSSDGDATTYVVDMTGVELATPELTLAYGHTQENAQSEYTELAKKLLYPNDMLTNPTDGLDKDTIMAGIFNADPKVATYAIQVSVPGESGSVVAKVNKTPTVTMPAGRGMLFFTLNPSQAPGGESDGGTWLYTGDKKPTTADGVYRIKPGAYTVELGTWENDAFKPLTSPIKQTITIGEVKAVESDAANAEDVEGSSVFFDATEANTKLEYTLPRKPESAPAGKEDYKFVGWKIKGDETNTIYNAETKATVPAGTVFYADWSNEVLLDAGFSWTVAEANAATGKPDCMDQTMWIKLNEGANGSYFIEVLKGSAPFYTDSVTYESETTEIKFPRWSYLNNGDHAQTASDVFVTPGDYTINLYKGKLEGENVVKDTAGDDGGLLGTKDVTIPAFPEAEYGLNVTFADTTATVTTEKPLYGRYFIELNKGADVVASTYTDVEAGTTTADSRKTFTFTNDAIAQGNEYTVNVYECNKWTETNYVPGPKTGTDARLTKTAIYTAADDVTLKTVTVNGTAATAGANNTYSITVANSVTEAEIVATATNSGATVAVVKQVADDVDPQITGSATLTDSELEVGSNNKYTITVTAGGESETYVLTITRKSTGGGGSGSGGGTTEPTTPPSPTPVPTPEPPKATVEPDVDGGVASGKVDGDTIGDLITEAGDKGAGEVVVEVKPEAGTEVTEVKTELPAESMKDLADAKVDLTVSTPVADVTLPQESLKELGAGEGAVTVTAAQTGDENSATITVTVEQGGKAVETGVTATVPSNVVSTMAGADNGTVTVSTPVADVVLPNSTLVAAGKNDVSVSAIPTANGTAIEVKSNGVTMNKSDILVAVPAADADDNTVAYIVDANGNKTILPKSAAVEGEMKVLLDTGKATITYGNNAKTFADNDSIPNYAKAAFTTSRELITGIKGSDGKMNFKPNKVTTRAELVTMLHRLESEPNGGNVDFDDMKGNEWYKEAAAWAQSTGVVTGTDTGFSGDKNISRQELATMLYRYMNNVTGYKGTTGDFSGIAGGDKVSNWASAAMKWAYGSGILTGKANSAGEVNLDPTGMATRAEVSAMLERFVKLIAG